MGHRLHGARHDRGRSNGGTSNARAASLITPDASFLRERALLSRPARPCHLFAGRRASASPGGQAPLRGSLLRSSPRGLVGNAPHVTGVTRAGTHDPARVAVTPGVVYPAAVGVRTSWATSTPCARRGRASVQATLLPLQAMLLRRRRRAMRRTNRGVPAAPSALGRSCPASDALGIVRDVPGDELARVVESTTGVTVVPAPGGARRPTLGFGGARRRVQR